MCREHDLNFGRLDTVAVDLHLIVDTAEELEVPAGQCPNAVTGAIDAARPVLRKWIGQEALVGLFRLGEIAAGNAEPTDAQLAWYPDREQLEIAVDDVGAAPG